jgi:hypothetical protein
VSTPLPDFVPDSRMAAAGREPGYSRVGTARQHHAAYSSTVRQASAPQATTHPPTQASSRHGALHGSTGRRAESWNPANSSQIRYEALEALQASRDSPRGSGAILAYASAILEAFPWQGRMAESQFRPLPVPRYPVLRTTHGTSNGFRENRGTGVDLPSPSTL